jgi:multicomponent Na+:H+ antiporter subunit E
MARVFLLFVVLGLVWLMWSGIYTPLVLGLGALSCALTVFIAHRIGFFEREIFALQVLRRLPRYWFWLFIEIIKSSLEVAGVVLGRRLEISPTVVKFRVSPDDAVGQAILGNSITLTPGTLTLDIHDGQITVHCLTKQAAEALMRGEFNERAAALTRQ